ncbi:MAG TPA: ABC transporter ATP-binding protein [Pyrinomonadaceae bacterium]|nr:ABC transporter ATP-binding protein [Pyrinomonadaceae bacterium]
MKPIVRVQGLSKQYRIGVRRASNATLNETISNVRSPWSLIKRNGDLRHEMIWALKDVSFEVEPGEALGIVGRNGAGKSTLLKILSRITEPTSGRVELFGRVGSLLEVGTGFHPELTGRENVYLNGAILGMKKTEIERKFDEIVAFAEIEKFIDTPVKWYSSGMYMRLAFAVAANFEPEVLIVDEVLAVGDGDFQKKCLGKMGEISRSGRTVIFVSHNMSAIEALCNRVLWLVDGKLVEKAETEKVVADYVSTDVAVSTEKVWNDPSTAPGDELIKLHSAKLRSLAQQNSGELSIDAPIELQFEFWNYQAGANLHFTIHLLTVGGVHVFAAVSELKHRPCGLVRETIKIPANFLNHGMYTITVQAVKDAVTALYDHPDVLVFEVLDSSEWRGTWPGVIKPRLEWVSEDIGEDCAFDQ